MGLFANLDLNSSISPVGPFEAESVIKTKSRTRLLIFDREVANLGMMLLC